MDGSYEIKLTSVGVFKILILKSFNKKYSLGGSGQPFFLKTRNILICTDLTLNYFQVKSHTDVLGMAVSGDLPDLTS